ncbi:MAG: SUMF1/EgtB/PvdO family nonheme iron enzyme [Acidobacteria bacterium]|nr:SUMF1/EgtB/PvdO family nonheme iron enzyme [Acidobacteriota bacterium]
MKRVLLIGIVLTASIGAAAQTKNWPAFRGQDARGIGEGKVVISWNADTTAGPLRNVLWSTEIPGLSHASPTIWGDRLFVVTSISSAGSDSVKLCLHCDGGNPADDNGEQTWIVYALDKNTGKILWERVALKRPPRGKRHPKGTHANQTIATDGQRIVVFLGSEGVYCYDFDGNLIWTKDLGYIHSSPINYGGGDWQLGTASSPIIFEDKVILQVDQPKDALLLALSVKNGGEVWRASREGVSTQSWATPTVVKTAGRTQVVTNSWPYVAGYDANTGKELWRLKSEGDLPAPAPIFGNGLIYVLSSHGPGWPLFAIFPDASGDITPRDASTESPGLAWVVPRNVYETMATPIVYGDLVYSIADNGILKVYDAVRGTPVYVRRIGAGTGFSASPIAIDSKIFFSSEEGEVFVVKAGREFELLAKNLMGEPILATPAFSDNTLYFRTRTRIIAIGAEAQPEMEFVKIQPGEFLMGCSANDTECEENEKPAHRVRIMKAFEIGKFEVTQAQWQAVMGTNPSRFKGPNLPVDNVSWNNTQEFLRKLNERKDGYRYRLPTEAEWEYAARAGTTSAFAGPLDAVAWYEKNSGSTTHPVGHKQPNAWGLYNVHGNVWEWVQDFYGNRYYASSPAADPPGAPSGEFRVMRGGSWSDVANYVRVSFRSAGGPGYGHGTSDVDIGFRCVREPMPNGG